MENRQQGMLSHYAWLVAMIRNGLNVVRAVIELAFLKSKTVTYTHSVRSFRCGYSSKKGFWFDFKAESVTDQEVHRD